MHGHRVVADVDRAEQAEVEVAVALLVEQVDRAQHQGVAAASVGVPAVAVVGGAVAVERDPDADVELVEEIEIAGAELDAVGVDPEVQLSDAVQGRTELLADPSQSRGPRQERFPAVQDHCDGGERVCRRVLGQTPGGPGNRLVGDDLGSGQPALIRVFVDIAVVAGEIAPAVHFEDEFAEGDQGSCHSFILATSDACSESGTEGGDPGGPGRRRAHRAIDLPGRLGAADIGRRESRAGLRRGGGRGVSVGLHGRPRGVLRGSVSGHSNAFGFRVITRSGMRTLLPPRPLHLPAKRPFVPVFSEPEHPLRSTARASGTRVSGPPGRSPRSPAAGSRRWEARGGPRTTRTGARHAHREAPATASARRPRDLGEGGGSHSFTGSAPGTLYSARAPRMQSRTRSWLSPTTSVTRTRMWSDSTRSTHRCEKTPTGTVS